MNRELDRLLTGLDIDHVLDVGGYVGHFAQSLRRGLGYNGRITSFEPVPDSFAVLKRKAASDPGWSVVNVALGSVDGSAEMSLFARPEMNSLHALSSHADTYAPGLAPTGSITIDVRRLDTLRNDLPVAGCNVLLKIDTQGHDMNVVSGTGAMLRSIRAVLMEVGVRPLYEGTPALPEVMAEMDRLGFELTGAFPIHRYSRQLRVIEFDCTFVNRGLIERDSHGG